MRESGVHSPVARADVVERQLLAGVDRHPRTGALRQDRRGEPEYPAADHRHLARDWLAWPGAPPGRWSPRRATSRCRRGRNCARPACRPGARCRRAARRDGTAAGRRRCRRSGRSARGSARAAGAASKDDPPGAVEQPASTPLPSSDARSSPRRLIRTLAHRSPSPLTEAAETRRRPNDTEVLELSWATKEVVGPRSIRPHPPATRAHCIFQGARPCFASQRSFSPAPFSSRSGRGTAAPAQYSASAV